jgi:hypothetical protein
MSGKVFEFYVKRYLKLTGIIHYDHESDVIIILSIKLKINSFKLGSKAIIKVK